MQHPSAHPLRPSLRPSTTGRRGRLVALVAIAGLLAAGCGDDSGDDEAVRSEVRIDQIGESLESGYPEDAEPERGGQLVYGLEAESDNWCLPSAQLAVAGQQVLRAIYDPLVLPDGEGAYRPYLADSIEPSDDYKTWNIKIRPNVTFHNGEKLTAQVVKNNLDAYRGAYPGRAALLFAFALDNIDTVSVTNELTVKVTTKVPWVAFPGALYQSGRFGILAQEQLDANEAGCETNPIGTGPFEFVSWDKGSSLKVARNANYWQIAPDGKPYPYVNAIDFRPMSNADERTAALVQGDINMMHTAVISDLVENIPSLRDEGLVNVMVSDDFTETSYAMFNASKPPFDRREARLAFTHALDREKLNEVANKGGAQLADGPFAPGVLGYVEDPERPEHDVAKAKALVEGLQAEGVDTRFTFVTTVDPAVIRWTSVAKAMLEEVGFEVDLVVEEQEQLVDRAIAGDYQVSSFRLQPGDDPDMNYVWWYGEGNPVNFAKFDDPEINEALKKGRVEADDEARRGHYETVARRMASEQYYSHLWYVPWAIVEASNVHGILGPEMPSGHAPTTRLANGHALHGVWIDR